MNKEEKQLQPETETSHQVGQDNLQIFGLDINAPVFLTSSLTIIIFVLVALVFQEKATVVFEDIRVWMTSQLDWVFLLTCSLLVLFCLYLIVSPLGKVRLGGTERIPGLLHADVDSYALFSRLGYRACLLGNSRACPAFSDPTVSHDEGL